jgi:hypothetical protein
MSEMLAHLDDGRVLHFPAGTDPSVIQGAVRKLMQPPVQGIVQQSENQTIGPQEERGPASEFEAQAWNQIPGAHIVSQGIDKLKEWAGMTQEGQTAHPAQAAVGQFADRLKQMLIGGKGGGLNMKTGFATNPVTSSLIAGPGEAIDSAAELAEGGTSLLKRGISAIGAAPETARATEAGRAITQTLAPEIQSAPIAATRGATTTGGASTAITNQEVLQHADQLGIKLTPAQALQTSSARSEQTLGEEALLTGSKIKEAMATEKAKLADQIEEFQDRLDPKRVGMSMESAGEHLQNSAEESRSAMKGNVNSAYDAVRKEGSDLVGDIQTPMNKFLFDLQNPVHPTLGIPRPVTQTAAGKTAIKDIEELLSDAGLNGPASIESLRNLRTTLLEKANDYGANALSDSGQRIYKLAVGKVDDAIMDAAKGTPFQETFRTAGQQNSKLQELYNTKGSPLYRILNTDDPAKIADGILSRSSVHELETLKGEKFDLGPIARQAVEDIKNGGFRITKDGLGGYSDTFLRSLLGPEQTKELYMKGDIARRLAENYNPSGSGKVVLGASQVFHPIMAAGAQIARSRSMPQAASKYLSSVGAAMK